MCVSVDGLCGTRQCQQSLERVEKARTQLAELQSGTPLEPEAESLADAEAAQEAAQKHWDGFVVTACKRFTTDPTARGSVADAMKELVAGGWERAVKHLEDRVQLALTAASKQVRKPDVSLCCFFLRD